jgi:hypothetical protein
MPYHKSAWQILRITICIDFVTDDFSVCRCLKVTIVQRWAIAQMQLSLSGASPQGNAKHAFFRPINPGQDSLNFKVREGLHRMIFYTFFLAIPN